MALAHCCLQRGATGFGSLAWNTGCPWRDPTEDDTEANRCVSFFLESSGDTISQLVIIRYGVNRHRGTIVGSVSLGAYTPMHTYFEQYNVCVYCKIETITAYGRVHTPRSCSSQGVRDLDAKSAEAAQAP